LYETLKGSRKPTMFSGCCQVAYVAERDIGPRLSASNTLDGAWSAATPTLLGLGLPPLRLILAWLGAVAAFLRTCGMTAFTTLPLLSSKTGTLSDGRRWLWPTLVPGGAAALSAGWASMEVST
ncbi:MAG: hypothetical protein ACKPKO_62420, partial [Candidatus Fonsibacter sp.]